MIGRSDPEARLVMTIERASSSSGEEGHRQDVVDAQVEGPELGLEIAPPGQAEDRRDAPPQGVRGAQAAPAAAVLSSWSMSTTVMSGRQVARIPRPRRGCARPARQRPVVQGQGDEVHDEGAIVGAPGRGAPHLLVESTGCRITTSSSCGAETLGEASKCPLRPVVGRRTRFPGPEGWARETSATHTDMTLAE